MQRKDIIFLSDIRLSAGAGSKNGIVRFKNFLYNNCNHKYECYSNSGMNKRGTAILVACDINFELISEHRDQEENIMLIHRKLNSKEFVLASVYAPNGTCRNFYRNLNAFLYVYPTLPVIRGGDWNTVLDPNIVSSNIDIEGLHNIPNSTNHGLLTDLCENFSLIDPFRALYPTKRDFSYVPFGNNRRNKSR